MEKHIINEFNVGDNSIVNNIYYFLEDNYPNFAGIFLDSLKKNVSPELFADIISKM